eukprot:TRINITY_DN59233_c0_g1_i2.p1 TRINITY_DN59233_c0_g1~~TRINITY_DN59233_c0_g1_i2.p1  ORF type:complete len:452 (-),score=212.26 TRINITY_DN59233_c0_g1_i2:846-2201(-)
MSETEDGNEVSIASVYCVVYQLEKQQWVVKGDGWSQVHCYRDVSDGSHRLVGWTVADFNVVLNCNITNQCKYKTKSDDFHKFTDENGAVYGLGFYKKEDSVVDAVKFLQTVQYTIKHPLYNGEDDKKEAPAAANNQSSTSGASAASGGGVPQLKHRQQSVFDPPELHRKNSKVMEQHYEDNIPLGKLKILPAKRARNSVIHTGAGAGSAAGAVGAGAAASAGGAEAATKITDPYGVIHTQSVRYDPNLKKYVGLPPEWEAHLQQQFGLPANQVDRTRVDGYTDRIPNVLLLMKDYLVANGGLEVEGIFRLAPDADEANFVKSQLNQGKFERCDDVNCIANLIKVWFRELPVHVLDSVDRQVINECDSDEQAGEIVQRLEDPWYSLFLWLLDLCVLVASNKAVNKMNPQNLFTPVGDPMTALKFSQKVAQFMYKAIQWREKQHAAAAAASHH